MKSVYSAVRTGSLNRAVWASYLKSQTYTQPLLANWIQEILRLNKHKFEVILYVSNLHRYDRQIYHKNYERSLICKIPTPVQYLLIRQWIPEYRIWIKNHSSQPHVKRTPKQKPNRAVKTSAGLTNLHFHFFFVCFFFSLQQEEPPRTIIELWNHYFLLWWAILIQAQEEEKEEGYNEIESKYKDDVVREDKQIWSHGYIRGPNSCVPESHE